MTKHSGYVLLPHVIFDSVCRTASRFFTDEQKEKVAASVEMALLCANFLAIQAHAAGKRLWKIVPKFHQLTHIAYDQAPQANPRRTHCYADEDLVGRIKRIAQRCHGGSVGVRAMQRYVILVGLRWWDELHRLRGLRPRTRG